MKFYRGLALILSIFTVSCGVTSLRTSDKSYSEYQEFYLDSLENFYSKEEDEYIVYLFSDQCRHCDNIKGNLFDHLDNIKNGKIDTLTYIYNMRSNSTPEGQENRSMFKQKEENYDREELIEEMYDTTISSISETYFFATPSIYLVKNHMFSEYFYGSTNSANYFDSH